MAQIRQRGPSQYQARVTLTGHSGISRTFSSRVDALAWAGERERLVTQGLGEAMREADQLTLYHALERYSNDVTPPNVRNSKCYRVRRWQQYPWADQRLSRIRAADFARFRDLRQQQEAGPTTVLLDLALVSHVFEMARKDWGGGSTQQTGTGNPKTKAAQRSRAQTACP